MNISQEARDAFEKENGMNIETAITHIEKWIDEGNFDSAEAGISEMKKFAESSSEVEVLEAKIRAKKTSTVQQIVEKKEEMTVKTSNLEEVKSDEKFLAAIGYFGYLGVLPLVLKRDSEFCQYHGKQSVALAIMMTFISALAVFMPLGFQLISILHLGISVFAFFQANSGKLWNMPLVGDIARKLNF